MLPDHSSVISDINLHIRSTIITMAEAQRGTFAVKVRTVQLMVMLKVARHISYRTSSASITP